MGVDDKQGRREALISAKAYLRQFPPDEYGHQNANAVIAAALIEAERELATEQTGLRGCADMLEQTLKQNAELKRELTALRSQPSAIDAKNEAALLPGLREALKWKPNTPQLENAMTYAWEQDLRSFIRSLESAQPTEKKPTHG